MYCNSPFAIREGVKNIQQYFLGISPEPGPPLPLGTFRNPNVTFDQKKVGFSSKKTTPVLHKL